METIEISQAEMATRIARFSDQESQSAHYAEALGIPRAAYEIMAAETLYLMMAPASQGGPMAQKPAIAGEPGVSVIIARCPPGDKLLLHAHHYTVESFMCLTGKFRIRWGSQADQHIDLEPHDMIAVPPGVDRQFENISGEEALLLVIITGKGDEDFADISMPPGETEFMRDRFGQSVIDGYNKIGVAFRNADGSLDGPAIPAPIEVTPEEMATRIARIADLQPLSATSGDSIGVLREVLPRSSNSCCRVRLTRLLRNCACAALREACSVPSSSSTSSVPASTSWPDSKPSFSMIPAASGATSMPCTALSVPIAGTVRRQASAAATSVTTLGVGWG